MTVVCILSLITVFFGQMMLSWSCKFTHTNLHSCTEAGHKLRTPLVEERPLRCVYRCLQKDGCKSFYFNTTSRFCWLLKSTYLQKATDESDLLFGQITVGSYDVGRYGNLTNWANRIFIIRGNMSYRAARAQCFKEGGQLVTIDSQLKQDIAAAIANTTDLEDIAIGLSRYNFHWRYENQQPLAYDNFVSKLGAFGGMCKCWKYRWCPVTKVNGGMCEYYTT